MYLWAWKICRRRVGRCLNLVHLPNFGTSSAPTTASVTPATFAPLCSSEVAALISSPPDVKLLSFLARGVKDFPLDCRQPSTFSQIHEQKHDDGVVKELVELLDNGCGLCERRSGGWDSRMVWHQFKCLDVIYVTII